MDKFNDEEEDRRSAPNDRDKSEEDQETEDTNDNVDYNEDQNVEQDPYFKQNSEDDQSDDQNPQDSEDNFDYNNDPLEKDTWFQEPEDKQVEAAESEANEVDEKIPDYGGDFKVEDDPVESSSYDSYNYEDDNFEPFFPGTRRERDEDHMRESESSKMDFKDKGKDYADVGTGF